MVPSPQDIPEGYRRLILISDEAGDHPSDFLMASSGSVIHNRVGNSLPRASRRLPALHCVRAGASVIHAVTQDTGAARCSAYQPT